MDIGSRGLTIVLVDGASKTHRPGLTREPGEKFQDSDIGRGLLGSALAACANGQSLTNRLNFASAPDLVTLVDRSKWS